MRNPLARWIMARATANPPRGREDWAAAMRGEFEVIDSGRLAWALGCWTTMTLWRARADWVFLAVLIVAPAVVQVVGPALAFGLSFLLPDGLFRQVMLPLIFCAPVLASAALACWRPSWSGTIALVMGTGTIAVMAGIQIFALRGGAWAWFGAPVWVGWTVTVAACWFAAAPVAWLRQPRPSSAA